MPKSVASDRSRRRRISAPAPRPTPGKLHLRRVPDEGRVGWGDPYDLRGSGSAHGWPAAAVANPCRRGLARLRCSLRPHAAGWPHRAWALIRHRRGSRSPHRRRRRKAVGAGRGAPSCAEPTAVTCALARAQDGAVRRRDRHERAAASVLEPGSHRQPSQLFEPICANFAPLPSRTRAVCCRRRGAREHGWLSEPRDSRSLDLLQRTLVKEGR